jgi:predicted PolB exonuclease-like 3'-5' exonuclease
MIFALDIETIPNTAMIDRLPEPEVLLGNLVDPAKIRAKQEAAKATQVEKMALDPLYGRVLCVAMVGEDGGSNCPIMPEATEEHERTLLQWLFGEYLCNPELRLVTWNGNGFDMPFIYRRAMALGVSPKHFGAPPLSTWTKKYGNDRHIDMMQAWGGTGGKDYIKLDVVAKGLLGESKNEIDVTQFIEQMKTPEGRSEIVKYCIQDTEIAMAIYKRALGTLF